MNVRIRRAAMADEAAIADLDLRTWSPDNAVIPRPGPETVLFDEVHAPEHYLVAERDGRVVGYVRLVRPTPLPCNAHVRQIQGLAVDPSEQGRGLGRLLVDAACQRARQEGASRITLRVLSTNPRARRLYERAGFTVEGVLRGEFYLAGRYVDDILMGRSLHD
ncbi:GNAT family N-acetyltransferase [Thermomonospora cellulosilytica]|uniref:Ribosomal protein S18 acetylase RimI-like enzyme n=1 Tax=Thermomonospora cellulosilytica TaxID=1411118 RepID=A0A7W3N526_9ACTN|nr:GNAT family N-acetyltransferase [Thermomonospora cellulosilytica]MBA9007688.1 ribosomal protein S18 acetylase RimI-like enzyme [Thermomonospora cellulosilytica]